ncbi:hypothetical protein EVAR_66121_1 [Eumeta japonica]|uniref:Uncharacterized protein n=1 Tax=Eumeta variegata TaxID=151549 RepID=A0A4C1ZVD8_EUMVA|nr:hypothetical protein EVAR_66121_1 [Eumeta japonica]
MKASEQINDDANTLAAGMTEAIQVHDTPLCRTARRDPVKYYTDDCISRSNADIRQRGSRAPNVFRYIPYNFPIINSTDAL